MCRRIKQVEYEGSQATPILNVMPDFLSKFYGTSGTESFERIHLLHNKNINQFKTLWGRQSCTWIGEYRNWIWLHEFNHANLFVLTSEKGTSYEIQFTGDQKLGKKEVQECLIELLEELRGLVQ